MPSKVPTWQEFWEVHERARELEETVANLQARLQALEARTPSVGSQVER